MQSRRRILLDTQAFILAAEGDKSVPPKSRTLFMNPNVDIFLSLVSLWEMQIKLGLGKLKLPVPLPMAVQRAVTDIGLEILPLQAEHIYAMADLPLHHRDPFDRLLIAQAHCEHMTILGNDAAFDAYGITRVW